MQMQKEESYILLIILWYQCNSTFINARFKCFGWKLNPEAATEISILPNVPAGKKKQLFSFLNLWLYHIITYCVGRKKWHSPSASWMDFRQMIVECVPLQKKKKFLLFYSQTLRPNHSPLCILAIYPDNVDMKNKISYTCNFR